MTDIQPASAAAERLDQWFRLNHPHEARNVQFDANAALAAALGVGEPALAMDGASELENRLITALKREFPILNAPDATWLRAVRGIIARVGLQEVGDDHHRVFVLKGSE